MHESLMRRMTAASRGLFESAREADLHLAFHKLESEFSGRGKVAPLGTTPGQDLLRSMAKTAIPEFCTFLERHFSTQQGQSVTQRDFLLTDAMVLNALADYIQQDPGSSQAKRLSRQIKHAVSESSPLRGLYHRELKRVTNVELSALSRLKVQALGTLATTHDTTPSALSKLSVFGLRLLGA